MKISSQIQEIQQILSTRNLNKISSKDIIISLLKTRDKEKEINSRERKDTYLNTLDLHIRFTL